MEAFRSGNCAASMVFPMRRFALDVQSLEGNFICILRLSFSPANVCPRTELTSKPFYTPSSSVKEAEGYARASFSHE
jgi:hypothetical protein